MATPSHPQIAENDPCAPKAMPAMIFEKKPEYMRSRVSESIPAPSPQIGIHCNWSTLISYTASANVIWKAKVFNGEGRKTVFIDNKPGCTWLNGFLECHPEVKQRKMSVLGEQRANLTESKIRAWFREVETSLVEDGIDICAVDSRCPFPSHLVFQPQPDKPLPNSVESGHPGCSSTVAVQLSPHVAQSVDQLIDFIISTGWTSSYMYWVRRWQWANKRPKEEERSY
ncbi:tigger transposable element-derived protein 6-like protein [Plakobranchus ocellatus]|uniref:Tigger transposable element-derived protein 6-like protein n=1 Tax=Plakobranchus ocellatus TaxID=259542 RepID=A0AAV4AW56_9GAST|nr:tigger transposable element-derived protein 6-like protein [Plakobranchus ocellatus]